MGTGTYGYWDIWVQWKLGHMGTMKIGTYRYNGNWDIWILCHLETFSSAVMYSTVQCCTVQCIDVQHSTVQQLQTYFEEKKVTK